MSFFKRETPHNHKDYAGLLLSYYTIPRNNRELQHLPLLRKALRDYTIPRNNRELQRLQGPLKPLLNYTIPRNNRELQHNRVIIHLGDIIPYQEIIGNYSPKVIVHILLIIIPYQEIIGNYSSSYAPYTRVSIIPYQEIIGNYSCQQPFLFGR